jgi:hypothetical protein
VLELGIRPMHIEVHDSAVDGGVPVTMKSVEDQGSFKILTTDPQRPHRNSPRARGAPGSGKSGMAEVSATTTKLFADELGDGQIKGGPHGKMGRQQGMVSGAAGFCRRGLQRHHSADDRGQLLHPGHLRPGQRRIRGNGMVQGDADRHRLHDALGASSCFRAWSC